jgi:energy-coupling factor transport system ATP-binding protein
MSTKINLEHVWFHYHPNSVSKKQWAVQDIHLSIDQGEYVSIIGANGSGKSSLACLLNGLFIPTEGHLYINGQAIIDEQSRWEIKQRIGIIFQNPDNQIVGPSVVDDIAFGLENLGVSREEMQTRIVDVLEQVGLTGYEDRQPHHLSGGQKQRLAIANMLAMKPDVLILDEATSMLDPDGREQILQIMEQLHRAGITIIHITHRAVEAFLAERVIVMNQGRLVMDEKREQMYAKAAMLENWGLDVPLAVQLYQQLLSKGWKLPTGVKNEEQLVGELCKYISTT